MTVPGTTPGSVVPADFMLPVRKSAGISSRRCLDLVARTLRRRDLGHAGTLDPFAEGLLLLLGGRATRMVPWIQGWDKEYVGRIRLGVATDSLDVTGAVVATAPVPDFTRDDLSTAARGLTGRLLQSPPMYSAAHSGGTRLYELARQGIEVERAPREREVTLFEVLSVALPDVDVRIVCSSGTYVRVLAEAFGRALELPAHLAALERRRIGPWDLERAVGDETAACGSMESLMPWLVPPAGILADWPRIVVPEDVLPAVRNGRLPPEWAGDALPAGVPTRLVSATGGLVALAEARPGASPRLLRVFETAADSMLAAEPRTNGRGGHS